MISTRFFSVLLVAMVVCAPGLGGCASHQPVKDQAFKQVGERTYKESFDHMFTLAQRTMQEMHLTRKTANRDESRAFLVFEVPETEYGEMVMDIRPVDAQSTHIILFSHDRADRKAAGHVLDNLDEQITLDRDPLHRKRH